MFGCSNGDRQGILAWLGFPTDVGLRRLPGFTRLWGNAIVQGHWPGVPAPGRAESMSLRAVLSTIGRLLGALFGRTRRRSGRAVDWSRTRAPLIDDDRVMQSHTHAWLRSIPNGLHPKQLCRHYPRIANRIATHWGNVQAVDRMLLDLMVDRRGNRMGFPPRIRHELDRLYGLHAKRMTPLLRGRSAAIAPISRPAIEPQRRVRLRTPVSVSSIKR